MDYQAVSSKVAIPRLTQGNVDDKSLPRKTGEPRAQKACENCRHRKVRCSGEQPQCQNCVSQDVHCTYPQTRKDRLKEATEHIDRLVALMKGLSARLDDSGQRKIDELLDSLGDYAPASNMTMETSEGRPTRTLAPHEENRNKPNPGEADVTGSVGSNDDLDLVDEDLFRSHESRATGFVGKNSEVQWLRSLKTQMANAESAGSPSWLPYGPPGSSSEAEARRVDASHARRKSSEAESILRVSDSAFYLDGDDLDVDIMVDPYEIPPPDIAESLFECYIRTVHTSFPVLPDQFEDQYRRYNESVKRSRPYYVPKDWQAMLNLVLAIGAQYSRLVQGKWRADERDHLVYMTRATRIIGLDKLATSFLAPTLSSIQITGLLSLYYLTIGQVSRAWMMIGISLRFALAVGLHLRNDDPSASPRKKESLVRIWWSLHTIESLICTLVGRPCVIPNDQCTVPLPSASPEGQSTDHHSAELSNLMHWQSQSATPRPFSSDLLNRGDSNTVARASFLGARVTMDGHNHTKSPF